MGSRQAFLLAAFGALPGATALATHAPRFLEKPFTGGDEMRLKQNNGLGNRDRRMAWGIGGFGVLLTFLSFGSGGEADVAGEPNVEEVRKLTAAVTAMNGPLVNGNFEDPQVPSGEGWARFGDIPGWTGSFDLHSDMPDQCGDGGQCVDLNTESPGYISTLLTTAPGRDYTISWTAGAHQFCQQHNARLAVEVDGTTIGYATSGTGQLWDFDISFVSTNQQTLFTFRSVTNGCGGAMVDNVKLVLPRAVEVPYGSQNSYFGVLNRDKDDPDNDENLVYSTNVTTCVLVTIADEWNGNAVMAHMNETTDVPASVDRMFRKFRRKGSTWPSHVIVDGGWVNNWENGATNCQREKVLFYLTYTLGHTVTAYNPDDPEREHQAYAGFDSDGFYYCRHEDLINPAKPKCLYLDQMLVKVREASTRKDELKKSRYSCVESPLP